ncbi:TPA: aldo/keto reductase [Klebsiella pneumoniae]
MKYVNLGRSGLKVSRLCLGCMSYGEPERLPQPWSLDEKASRPLIRQALEAGINFFDTANIYSGGSSEEITGKALREMARRDEIVVATKTFFPWRNSPNTGFLSPWSPMARGRLTRDWSVTSRRTQNDAFALKMYENAALLDKPVIDVVASIAEKHAVPRAHVAIAWLLSKSVITAPIIGATKPEHLSTAISALDFSLSDAEITELEARYLPHPVDGIIPPLPDTPPSLTPPSAIQNY